MGADTEIALQNSSKPFGLVLSNREAEVVASIPDAPVASVAPEKTRVERDNVVTKIRDIAVFTPTRELPRVTTSPRKTGRWRVVPARQGDYVMNWVNCETNRWRPTE